SRIIHQPCFGAKLPPKWKRKRRCHHRAHQGRSIQIKGKSQAVPEHKGKMGNAKRFSVSDFAIVQNRLSWLSAIVYFQVPSRFTFHAIRASTLSFLTPFLRGQ